MAVSGLYATSENTQEHRFAFSEVAQIPLPEAGPFSCPALRLLVHPGPPAQSP